VARGGAGAAAPFALGSGRSSRHRDIVLDNVAGAPRWTLIDGNRADAVRPGEDVREGAAGGERVPIIRAMPAETVLRIDMRAWSRFFRLVEFDPGDTSLSRLCSCRLDLRGDIVGAGLLLRQ